MQQHQYQSTFGTLQYWQSFKVWNISIPSKFCMQKVLMTWDIPKVVVFAYLINKNRCQLLEKPNLETLRKYSKTNLMSGTSKHRLWTQTLIRPQKKWKACQDPVTSILQLVLLSNQWHVMFSGKDSMGSPIDTNDLKPKFDNPLSNLNNSV